MALDYSSKIAVFKALADETRMKIIDMLSCGELCANAILEEFNITQPTLSYHMKILTESGLVVGVRDGAWMRYNLIEPNIRDLKEFLAELTRCKRADRVGKCPQS